MTSLLIKLFIKNNDVKNPKVRAKYGVLSGVVGIIINFLLALGKFIVGSLTASISITADALNNLSDAGSSVISLVSFKISSKPADREHPFGHERIEYIVSMIVSFSILLIGYELIVDSIKKIISGGGEAKLSVVAVVILAVSVLLKIWLCLFNRKIGKKISSSVIIATSADSLSDALSTLAVLVSGVVSAICEVNLDAYMGVIVSLIIIRSGVGIFSEATSAILGKAPEPQMIEDIKRIIMSHPEAIGIHDMAVHSYGPSKYFVTAHVEVDGEEDVFKSHDVIDNIEKEMEEKLGVICSIHLDPIALRDEKTQTLREAVVRIADKLDMGIGVHDFRIVPGVTHTNLIFDIAVPFEVKLSDSELVELFGQRISELDKTYFAVITVDRQ